MLSDCTYKIAVIVDLDGKPLEIEPNIEVDMEMGIEHFKVIAGSWVKMLEDKLHRIKCDYKAKTPADYPLGHRPYLFFGRRLDNALPATDRAVLL